ncbi:hypothetical protein F8M41_017984 [Gigaspora margarita]|uniref:Transmembrane protein n=1 Tax=Gigaspora margarita TaxID=4874 RepID=A0A8H4AMF0_GIGMA|nr:hypothetical protein F8M41_017984 [Gigaspora margarita]
MNSSLQIRQETSLLSNVGFGSSDKIVFKGILLVLVEVLKVDLVELELKVEVELEVNSSSGKFFGHFGKSKFGSVVVGFGVFVVEVLVVDGIVVASVGKVLVVEYVFVGILSGLSLLLLFGGSCLFFILKNAFENINNKVK